MIEKIFIFLTAFLPVAVLLIYIYETDHYKREPLKWLFGAFLAGLLAAGLTLLAGYPMFGSGLYSFQPFSFSECLKEGFLSQAIPSEVAKFIMLWLLVHMNRYYDEYVDSIVYSTCIALGFVGINNAYFLFHTEQWVEYGLAHALFLVPFHFAYGAVMGYVYGFSRKKKNHKWVSWFLALVVAIIIDGFASAVLMSIDLPFDRMPLFPILVALSYGLLYCLTKFGIKHMLKKDLQEMIENN